MTRVLRALIMRLARPLRAAGLCGIVGFVAGLISGGLIALVALLHPETGPDFREAVLICLMLIAFVWMFVLLLLVGTAKMRLTDVGPPSLVNVALTVGLTSLLSFGLDWSAFGFPIGLLVGLIVGVSLCRLNAALGGFGCCPEPTEERPRR